MTIMASSTDQEERPVDATPGCTSATRTAPTGPSPEVATATTRARRHCRPPTASSTLARDAAVRCGRVMPMAARVGWRALRLHPPGEGLAHDHQAEQRRQGGERLEGDDLGSVASVTSAGYAAALWKAIDSCGHQGPDAGR